MTLEKQIQLLEKLTGKKVNLEEGHDHCDCGGHCCTDKESLKEGMWGTYANSNMVSQSIKDLASWKAKYYKEVGDDGVYDGIDSAIQIIQDTAKFNGIQLDKEALSLEESIHHATYYCFSIDENYQIVNTRTAPDDLAADAYTMYANNYNQTPKPECLFSLCTTHPQWEGLAEEAIKLLKAGTAPKDIDIW